MNKLVIMLFSTLPGTYPGISTLIRLSQKDFTLNRLNIFLSEYIYFMHAIYTREF